jgi:hypothetical protein
VWQPEILKRRNKPSLDISEHKKAGSFEPAFLLIPHEPQEKKSFTRSVQDLL